MESIFEQDVRTSDELKVIIENLAEKTYYSYVRETSFAQQLDTVALRVRRRKLDLRVHQQL